MFRKIRKISPLSDSKPQFNSSDHAATLLPKTSKKQSPIRRILNRAKKLSRRSAVFFTSCFPRAQADEAAEVLAEMETAAAVIETAEIKHVSVHEVTLVPAVASTMSIADSLAASFVSARDSSISSFTSARSSGFSIAIWPLTRPKRRLTIYNSGEFRWGHTDEEAARRRIEAMLMAMDVREKRMQAQKWTNSAIHQNEQSLARFHPAVP